jgi:hypothetical protein
VGQALLEEWDRVVEIHSTEKLSQQPGQGGRAVGRQQLGRGRGGDASGGVRRGKK